MPSAGRSRTLVRLGTASAITALAVGLAGCDAPPPSANGTPRTVSVTGTGQVQGTPDTLNTMAAINYTAADATTAMNQANDRQRTVIDALVGAGVSKSDIATTNVTLQPQFGPDGTAITGYQASNSINVTIRDVGSASKILGIVVFNGGDALRINSVKFTISDDSQLVRDARTQAFEDARDRAEQYAEMAGMRLGKILTISESADQVESTPNPVGPRAAMASPVPLEPGQQTVGFTVNVDWELN